MKWSFRIGTIPTFQLAQELRLIPTHLRFGAQQWAESGKAGRDSPGFCGWLAAIESPFIISYTAEPNARIRSAASIFTLTGVMFDT